MLKIMLKLFFLLRREFRQKLLYGGNNEMENIQVLMKICSIMEELKPYLISI